MRMLNIANRAPLAKWAGLTCMLSLATMAVADVTVVSRTRIEGGEPGKAASSGPGMGMGMGQPPLGEATVRYKGGAMRTETPEGALIATKELLIRIDDKKRIWSATPVGKVSSALDPMLSMVKIQTKTVVVPGGKTKTILGKPARNWVVLSTINIGLPQMGAMLGGGDDAKVPQGLAMKMRTEMWTTESVDVGGRVAMLGGGAAAPGAGLLKEMLEKMATIPGLPLVVSMSQSFSMPTEKGAKPPKPMTVVTEVVSLDEKPLPAEMFKPPKGYRQVTSESMTGAGGMFPGMPGGGRLPGGGAAPGKR